MPALAYFITFSTYGARLHGHESGTVDRRHNAFETPFLPPDHYREAACGSRMREHPYTLDEPRRETVGATIQEVLRHRRWHLWALHVRTNHVHLVVTASSNPEKVMSDVKAWCSRRLRERHGESADRTRWAQHGSTKYLMTEDDVHTKARYVLARQGEPMVVAFDPTLAALAERDEQEPEA